MKKTTRILSLSAVMAVGATSLVACLSAGDGEAPQHSGTVSVTSGTGAAAGAASTGANGASTGAGGAVIKAPGASVSGGAGGGRVHASDAAVSGGSDGAGAAASGRAHEPASPSPTRDTTATAKRSEPAAPTSTQTDESWWTDPAIGLDSIPEGWPTGMPAAGGWEVFAEEGVKCVDGTATFDQDGMAQKLVGSCPNIVVRGDGMVVVVTKGVDTVTVKGAGNEVAVASVKTVTVSGTGNRVAHSGSKPAVQDRGTGNVVSTEPLAEPGGVG